MSDRFDYLEIGDQPPMQPAAPADTASVAATPAPWTQTTLKAVEVIGAPGTTPHPFSGPRSLATDRDGTLYVADTGNHRVQRIIGEDLRLYGKPGTGLGQLWGPRDVAVDPTGQYLFVAEQGNNRVQCLMMSGQHAAMYTGFDGPCGVAFDREGMLWIADTGNSRILRLNPRTGEYIGCLDKNVGIARPTCVSCDPIGNVYVTDAATSDVTRYSAFGARGHALGELRRLSVPQQTALDADGRIFLAESGANRLHVFGADCSSLATFESPGTKLGPLNGPVGVALGPAGEIYVSDTLNNRILRLAWGA